MGQKSPTWTNPGILTSQLQGCPHYNLLSVNTQEGDYQFAHYAFYNDLEGRIEMHLISQQAQTVHIGEQTIPFKAGETILTEVSYKYTLGEFQHLAAQAGFSVGRA
ncbi:MAG: L-histidine N(alpha)-methyltransferase, partial [Fimbriimonadales bacterium]|nr:L-histidine N(alpha)-methyltransferase [Fimbriimonadales bacterium]